MSHLYNTQERVSKCFTNHAFKEAIQLPGQCLQEAPPTENTLLFIYYDLALFPVIKEAVTSLKKKKDKMRQTRNILTGNGLHCINVKATNGLGVLTVCQWE